MPYYANGSLDRRENHRYSLHVNLTSIDCSSKLSSILFLWLSQVPSRLSFVVNPSSLAELLASYPSSRSCTVGSQITSTHNTVCSPQTKSSLVQPRPQCPPPSSASFTPLLPAQPFSHYSGPQPSSPSTPLKQSTFRHSYGHPHLRYQITPLLLSGSARLHQL